MGKKFYDADCENCKHCTWVKAAYEPIIVNVCEVNHRSNELSLEELRYCALNGVCAFFEKGTPTTDLSRISYDD